MAKDKEETSGVPMEAAKTTFLQRRIEYLLKLLRDGKLILDHNANIELRNELAKDLYEVQRHPNGQVNVATCTPLVRSMARSIYSLQLH